MTMSTMPILMKYSPLTTPLGDDRPQARISTPRMMALQQHNRQSHYIMCVCVCVYVLHTQD